MTNLDKSATPVTPMSKVGVGEGVAEGVGVKVGVGVGVAVKIIIIVARGATEVS